MVSKKGEENNPNILILVACVAAVFGVMTGVLTAATNRVLADLPVWVSWIISIAAFVAIIFCMLYIIDKVSLLEKKKGKK